MGHEHHHGIRFCPACGAGVELRLLRAGDPERLVCTACTHIHYLDPKVAVGTIIRLDGGVLLVRRAIEPGYGLWVFPGGYVDRGEPVESAAVREAREECGLEVALDGLVNVYSYRGRIPIIIVYAARVLSGALTLDEEGLEAGTFTSETVPWDALAFRSTREALQDYFAGRLYRQARGVPEAG
jgi:8-oxo-dGTP diphosphatase